MGIEFALAVVVGTFFGFDRAAAPLTPRRIEVAMPKHGNLSSLKRLFLAGDGRVAASIVLICVLGLSVYSEKLAPADTRERSALVQLLDFAAAPFRAGRTLLFDGFQRLFPRHVQGQPVTVIGIDEASLTRVGQWPWPRNRLAELIDAIAIHTPAAIGINIYMPEVDQTSPGRVAANLPAEHALLARGLQLLPSHDTRLAQSLSSAPTVLGVAGFSFPAPSTTTTFRSPPWNVVGRDALEDLPRYAAVLASLPELQEAASGQGLVSIKDDGVVRRVPLAFSVNQQIVPSFAMEILRIATGAKANNITSDVDGVTSVQVADHVIPTQQDGEIWVHFAPAVQGAARNVSAVDVLEGKVLGQAFAHKLVLVGLTGAGLIDRLITPLGEAVPGVEVQAQLLESMLDGRLLLRPWWMLWVESTVLIVLAGLLIWVVPRSAGSPTPVLKMAPTTPILAVAAFSLLALAVGFALFLTKGWLFNSASLILGLATVLSSLIYSVMMLVYRQTGACQ